MQTKTTPARGLSRRPCGLLARTGLRNPPLFPKSSFAAVIGWPGAWLIRKERGRQKKRGRRFHPSVGPPRTLFLHTKNQTFGVLLSATKTCMMPA